MTCVRCGQPMSVSVQFCPACGERSPAPGQPAVASAGSPGATSYAGFLARYVAWYVDWFVISVLSLVLVFAQLVVEILILPRWFFRSGFYEVFLFLFYSAAFVLGGGVYYAWMESSAWQGTLGKLALGIRVTDPAGGRLSFGRALGRYFAKFISNVTFGIGYLTIVFTERKQGLHDMIATTVVVQRRADLSDTPWA